jgi:hypothetical protein
MPGVAVAERPDFLPQVMREDVTESGFLAFPDEEYCTRHLQWLRWKDNIVSPFDDTSHVYTYADVFMCKKSNKYFTVRTGTIFQGTKVPLQKWFYAIHLMQQNFNIKSTTMAEKLNVPQRTAYSLMQRLHFAFSEIFKVHQASFMNVSFDELLSRIVLVDIGPMKW